MIKRQIKISKQSKGIILWIYSIQQNTDYTSKYRLEISKKDSLIFGRCINPQCKTTDILLIIQAKYKHSFSFCEYSVQKYWFYVNSWTGVIFWHMYGLITSIAYLYWTVHMTCFIFRFIKIAYLVKIKYQKCFLCNPCWLTIRINFGTDTMN